MNLVEKWEKTGLLEKLSDSAKIKMATLLDTQTEVIAYWHRERPVLQPQYGNMEFWCGVIHPIVRKAFGPLVELENVNVGSPSPTERSKYAKIRVHTDHLKTIRENLAPSDLIGGCFGLHGGLDLEAEICALISDDIEQYYLPLTKEYNLFIDEPISLLPSQCMEPTPEFAPLPGILTKYIRTPLNN